MGFLCNWKLIFGHLPSSVNHGSHIFNFCFEFVDKFTDYLITKQNNRYLQVEFEIPEVDKMYEVKFSSEPSVQYY